MESSWHAVQLEREYIDTGKLVMATPHYQGIHPHHGAWHAWHACRWESDVGTREDATAICIESNDDDEDEI